MHGEWQHAARELTHLPMRALPCANMNISRIALQSEAKKDVPNPDRKYARRIYVFIVQRNDTIAGTES
jgi:hypothetical protein